MLYFTTLYSVSSGMNGDWRIDKILKEGGRGLVEIWSWKFHGGTEENRRNLIRDSEVWTDHVRITRVARRLPRGAQLWLTHGHSGGTVTATGSLSPSKS
jgi:hypothetical protein